MSEDEDEDHPATCFYVMMVINFIIWSLLFLLFVCFRFYKEGFCIIKTAAPINENCKKSDVSTQTDVVVSTVIIHPDLDLGIVVQK